MSTETSGSEPAKLLHEIAVLRERMHEAESIYRALTAGEVDAVVTGPDEEHKAVLVMHDHARVTTDQATIDAIRSGSVDAFVVGDQSVQLLESAQTPYRVAMERMHDGAVTVGPEGGILFANGSFAEMLRVSRESLIGRRLAELVASADAGTLEIMLRSTEDRNGELRLHGPEGSEVAVFASMTPLEGCRLFLMQDVTMRKLHRAIDARTRRFLAMLAHEFGNILHPIRLANERISLLAQDGDTRESVAVIRRQVDRLSGLVDDLRRVNRD